MEVKQVEFNNKGMFQDSSISKASNDFAFENHNIRITAVQDNTLLSITCEKGPGDANISISPTYTILNKVVKKALDKSLPNGTVARSFFFESEFPVATPVAIQYQGVSGIKTLTIKAGDIKSPEVLNETLKNSSIVTPSSKSDTVFTYYTEDEATPQPVIAYPVTSSLEGIYLGHCILNQYLVVFTHSNTRNEDYIYRLVCNVDEGGASSFSGDMIFHGDLGFKETHAIECLPLYESEDIQKVYWVDGYNQPRMINIKSTNNYSRSTTKFDFITTLNKYPRVKISKDFNGLGVFPGGTIQYFLTYYDKFGSETNIVWSSALHYISFKDRGAKADELVSCNFNVSITNLDQTFDCLRLYSAKRSTKDGPVTLNIVADVNIKGKDSIQIIDSNTNQETIDPNLLLYLGGVEISAGSIAQKNDTLFLGNITLKGDSMSPEMKASLEALKSYNKTTGFYEASAISFTQKCFAYPKNSSYYHYKSQLTSSSKYIKSFKYGEIYRFAIQFQNRKGQWTQPVWIGDKKCEVPPLIDENNAQEVLSNAYFTWSNSIVVDDKFTNYRILMAETNATTRSILAQGVVCPTVFNYEERCNNQPFAVSSWIMRPRNGNVHFEHMDTVGDNRSESAEIQLIETAQPPIVDTSKGSPVATASSYVLILGFSPGHELDWSLCVTSKTNINEVTSADLTEVDHNSWDKGRWIDCHDALREQLATKWQIDVGAFLSDYMFERFAKSDKTFTGWVDNGFGKVYSKKGLICNGRKVATLIQITTESKTSLDIHSKKEQYYIDSSVLTFHSPEVEENQELLDNSDLSFRIVGAVVLDSNYSDISLETSSIGMSPNSSFVKEGTGVSSPSKVLVSGFFYQDWQWKDDKTPNNQKTVRYKTYLWNKTGSLIGQDAENSAEAGLPSLYAKLKHKVIANQRYSYVTKFFPKDFNSSTGQYEPHYWNSGISPVVVFNSDEIQMKLINAGFKTIYYYGNYDKLVTTTIPYRFVDDANSRYYFKENGATANPANLTDPVRIKFKSTPHAVFSLTSSNTRLNILPILNNTESYFDILQMYEELPEGTVVNYAWNAKQFNSQTIYSDADNRFFAGIYHINDATNPDTELDSIDERVIRSYQWKAGSERRAVIYYYTSSDNGETVGNQIHRTPNIVNYQVKLAWGTIPGGEGYTRTITQVTSWYRDLKYWSYPYTVDNSTGDILYGGDYSVIPSLYFKVENAKTVWENIVSYTQSRASSMRVNGPYLYLAELYRNIPYSTLYGGTDENAINKINWIPIADAINVGYNTTSTEGDTYFQRWDCLKTYPFTEEDENSVVDITSFMVETHINLDGRCDVNRGTTNILNTRPTNFNLMNSAYTQTNNLFRYNVLDSKYDLNTFTNEITWSLPKSPTENIDSWTNLNLASILNVDGQYGPINKILNVNDSLIFFQDKAIGTINYNNRTQISTEQGVPVEIANSGKVDGYTYASNNIGCLDKWAIVKASSGVYFIDSLNKALYSFGKDGVKDISSAGGMSQWFKEKVDVSIWTPQMTNDSFRLSYDALTDDLYITNRDYCLLYNEGLQAFTSFMPYTNKPVLFNMLGKSFIINGSTIQAMFAGDYCSEYSVEYRVNPEPMMDKLFTNVEFIADYFNNGTKVDNPSTLLTGRTPFDTVEAWNEYQYGSTSLTTSKFPSPLKEKFRIWRADIPRDANSPHKLGRMRNPWIHLKLSKENNNNKFVFHNLLVKYYR